VLFGLGGRKLARTVTAEVQPLAIPSDSASVAEGERLVSIYMCAKCHGEQLEGHLIAEDPVFGRLVAPHIAPGAGSVTAGFTEDQWVRAIRHGVGGDGRPLVVMPSYEYNTLSREDLGRIIAYVKQVPAVDHTPPKMRLRLAQVLIGAGVFPFDYDRIDHSVPPVTKPASDDLVAKGRYVGMLCRACHGADLMGSEDMGGPQLARGGKLDAYDEAAFRRVFSTGVAADGHAIDPEKMPWESLGHMTDEELHAVWAYLRTVSPPAAPAAP